MGKLRHGSRALPTNSPRQAERRVTDWHPTLELKLCILLQLLEHHIYLTHNPRQLLPRGAHRAQLRSGISLDKTFLLLHTLLDPPQPGKTNTAISRNELQRLCETRVEKEASKKLLSAKPGCTRLMGLLISHRHLQ